MTVESLTVLIEEFERETKPAAQTSPQPAQQSSPEAAANGYDDLSDLLSDLKYDPQ